VLTALLNLVAVIVSVMIARYEQEEGYSGWAVFWLLVGVVNAFFFFGWLL
jgi:hypothetical protein